MYEVLVLCFLLYNEVHIATFNAIGQNNHLLCLTIIPHSLNITLSTNALIVCHLF